MAAPQDLYVELHAAAENAEEIVLRLVAPMARELAEDPKLDTLFFGLFSDPSPQVRFRIAGPKSWTHGPVRKELERRAQDLERDGVLTGVELGHYGREVERYGGEAGMRLTERIYHHDSLACLQLLEADAAGELQRDRKEIAIAMTERYLDGLGMLGEARIAFYKFASRWPDTEGDWQPGDAATLDARYAAVKDGLTILASGSGAPDHVIWGGPRAAQIAEATVLALGTLLEDAAQGVQKRSIQQDLTYLAWSWTHLHCNRLGIPALTEAILRQLMLRHHRTESTENG